MEKTAAPDLAPFGRFLRPTGKGTATRYGRPPERIRPDTIVALTHDEATRYRREYDRQIREGALEEVKAEAYASWLTKRAADAKAAGEARAAAAKAAESAEPSPDETSGSSGSSRRKRGDA